MKITFTSKMPKEQGYYIIHRTAHSLSSPQLVNVRYSNGELEYIGGNSCFPLKRLKGEKGVKYSQKLDLGE